MLFSIRFKADDIGTHFWHSHVGEQRADGVFGAIIVKPKNDLNSKEYDYDLNEHVIILNDWFDETIISKFAFNHHGTTDNDKPTAILINGRGFDSRENNTPLAVFNVQKGFRYRFRLINSGVTFCPIQFMVDNHTLTVISTDGKSVEPEEFHAVTLHAG